MTNASPAMAKFEAVTPRIPVTDVEKALEFYIAQLGFRLGWNWGKPLTHANVCRDSIALDLVASPAGRSGTAMAYIQLSGVDAYFSELKGRNVESSALQNRAYGMRDFEIVDPYGNRLVFGEPTTN